MSFIRHSWIVPACAAAALVYLALWIGQRRLIYLPFGRVPAPADVGLPGAESVSYSTRDGLTLHAWFVPPTTSRRSRAWMTVIVFPGNAGHRGLRAPLAAALAPHGIATLLVDYRGYGGNPGSPDEAGLAEDARAALAYVTGRGDVDARRVAYFGESLGSGVAVSLATARPPAALILRSPFTSLADVGAQHYPFLPVRLLLRDRFESLGRIRAIACPLLVIAGDRDGIIPIVQSEQLLRAAPVSGRFVTIRGADHNDYELLAGEQLISAVVGFLRANSSLTDPV